jgi:hypothetical protein
MSIKRVPEGQNPAHYFQQAAGINPTLAFEELQRQAMVYAPDAYQGGKVSLGWRGDIIIAAPNGGRGLITLTEDQTRQTINAVLAALEFGSGSSKRGSPLGQ